MKIVSGLIAIFTLFLIGGLMTSPVMADDLVAAPAKPSIPTVKDDTPDAKAKKPTIELNTKSFSTDAIGPNYTLQVVIKVIDVPKEVDKEGVNISLFGQLSNTKHQVEFEDIRHYGNIATTHYWSANMNVKGYDNDGLLTIPVWLKYGELVAQVTDIEFERKAKINDFSWTVTSPAPSLALEADQIIGPVPVTVKQKEYLAKSTSTDFMIETKKHPAKGLRVVGSTLQDETTLQKILVKDFKICVENPIDKESADKCVNDTIPAGKLVSVNLKVKNPPAAGVYKGNVTIAVDGNGQETFPLTVYSRVAWAWLKGGLVISIGLLFGFFTNVWGRHLLARNRAKVTVKRLALRVTQLSKIASELGNIEGEYRAPITEILRGISNTLNKALLKENGIIPGYLPDSDDIAGWAVGFKSFIEPEAQRVEAIGGLVEKGLIPLDDSWQDLTDDSKKSIGELLIAKSTLNIKTVTEAENILKEISGLIAKEKQTIDDQHSRRAVRISGLSIEERIENDIQKLVLTNQAISIFSWVFWLLISLVGGYAALIMNDLSFGMVEDYLVCLLWGFGISIGSDQVKALSPASIATSIGVAVPKPVGS